MNIEMIIFLNEMIPMELDTQFFIRQKIRQDLSNYCLFGENRRDMLSPKDSYVSLVV